MNKTTSLYDFAGEMETWLKFSQKFLEKAKGSGITTANSPALRKLIRDWERGIYDEDPAYVGQWLETILKKEAKN